VSVRLSQVGVLLKQLKVGSRKQRHTSPGTLAGRPLVKRFALRYRTVVLSVYLSLPVLSVTLVYSGQTVGRIKMKLGMQVGLGPGHIVLDGNPAPPPKKKATQPPIFGPCTLWLNGWLD